MYCTNCGAYIKDEYHFCTRCGAKRPPALPSKKGSHWVPLVITGGMFLTGLFVYIISLYAWPIN